MSASNAGDLGFVDWGAQVYPQYYWGTEDLATGEDIVHNCGYNAWAGAMGDPCTGDRMDDQFGKMKTNFVDKGVPVIIGEFGANDRVGVLTGDKYAKHRKGRLAYYDYLMKSAKRNKVVPIAWDTGHEGENNMTIIRRQTEPDGSVFDMEILNIMRHAYGLTDYVNNGITHVENFKTDDGTNYVFKRSRSAQSLTKPAKHTYDLLGKRDPQARIVKVKK